MSRVRIDSDEWYPVYSVRSDGGLEVEATDEQIARWAAAHEAFEMAQDEMAALHEAAADAERERERERAAQLKAERQRIARERQAAAEALQASRDAMWDQIRESGGVIYDAQGQRIGEVQSTYSGVKLEP